MASYAAAPRGSASGAVRTTAVPGIAGACAAAATTTSRPVRGTRTEWTRYRVVLDVPEKANQIVYGFLLTGTGQVWADGIELEVVGDDVPVTDLMDR